MLNISGGVTAPQGFLAAGILCGIKKGRTKPDLAMLLSDRPCVAAGIYTSNLVQGAPIVVTREHLEDGYCRGVICNSGNANTCNANGYEMAKRTCEAAALATGLSTEDFAVASTGVIGQPVNLDAILAGIPKLAGKLSVEGSQDAAEAIMTTDTIRKEAAVQLQIGGETVRIGAMCKGSGMICPNMATMLAFVTTDARISQRALDRALRAAAARSFNRLSVDGDTSTNDTLLAMANGAAGNAEIDSGEDFRLFEEALTHLCVTLAKLMARDGEGATKLVECVVRNARDEASGVLLAKAVIKSSLVKAAMFGADANWGRVLCALGYSGVPLDPLKVDVAFVSPAGRVAVCAGGYGLPFSEEKAKEILTQEEIVIDVDVHLGEATGNAWGCDLTYDYVKINGDYRT